MWHAFGTTPDALATVESLTEDTQTVANGCGRLSTVAVAHATFGEHSLTPRPPSETGTLATHSGTWENQVLETFWESNMDATWTQHGRNMPKNLGKHQVLETFWKETWTKTWANTRLLKHVGKQHGSSMKATLANTLENTRFLNRCRKQHGHNMKATCA